MCLVSKGNLPLARKNNRLGRLGKPKKCTGTSAHFVVSSLVEWLMSAMSSLHWRWFLPLLSKFFNFLDFTWSQMGIRPTEAIFVLLCVTECVSTFTLPLLLIFPIEGRIFAHRLKFLSHWKSPSRSWQVLAATEAICIGFEIIGNELLVYSLIQIAANCIFKRWFCRKFHNPFLSTDSPNNIFFDGF